jgi:hypothetical protein
LDSLACGIPAALPGAEAFRREAASRGQLLELGEAAR